MSEHTMQIHRQIRPGEKAKTQILVTDETERGIFIELDTVDFTALLAGRNMEAPCKVEIDE